MAVDATGVLACFVTDVRVARTIGVRVAASGVPDCLVVDFCVAVPIEVRVAASGVFARFVAVASVALSLGPSAESAPATSAEVGSFTRVSGVAPTWPIDVGTNGPK